MLEPKPRDDIVKVAPSGVTNEPKSGSPVAYFVDLVGASHGIDFVGSWLLPSFFIRMPSGDMAFQTCVFTWDTIYTTGAGIDRIRDKCWFQLKEAGVAIKEADDLRAAFQKWGRDQRNKQQQGRKAA